MDYDQYNELNRRCKHRKLLLMHGRDASEHCDLPPIMYKPRFFIIFPLRLSGPLNNSLLLLTIILFFVLPIYITLPLFLLVLTNIIFTIRTKFQFLIKREEGLPHVYRSVGSIKDEKFYQNLDFLKKAYTISPYRLNLYYYGYKAGIITKDEFIAFYTTFKSINSQIIDQYKTKQTSTTHKSLTTLLSTQIFNSKIDHVSNHRHVGSNVIFYQPIEGFCFPATLSTIVLSLPDTPLVGTPPDMLPTRLDELELRLPDYNLITKSQESKFHQQFTPPLSQIQCYNVDNNTIKFEQFQEIILQANHINKRVIVNFLRSPLFTQKPGGFVARAVATIMGHWSPVGSVVFNDEDEQYYALIYDVNHTYGAWMVSLQDLFNSCYTRDEKGFRGIAVLDINDDIFDAYDLNTKA